MAAIVSQALLHLQQCPSDDEKEIVRLLGVLKALPMTIDLLGSTKVAIHLKQAKKTMPASCAEFAQSIINGWRKLIFSIDLAKPKLVAQPLPPKSSSLPSASSSSSSSKTCSSGSNSGNKDTNTHSNGKPHATPLKRKQTTPDTLNSVVVTPKVSLRPAVPRPTVVHVPKSEAEGTFCGFSSPAKRMEQAEKQSGASLSSCAYLNPIGTAATAHMTTSVPSLFDICADLMGVHLEKIPIASFALLPQSLFQRAVIARIRPSTKLLQKIEAVNPSLEGCCDDIWKHHCLRQYPQFTEKDKPDGVLWKSLMQDLEAEQAAKLANFSRKAKGQQQNAIDYKTSHATKMMSSTQAMKILNKKRGRAVVDKAGEVRIVGGPPADPGPSPSVGASPKLLNHRNDLFARAKREASVARHALRP